MARIFSECVILRSPVTGEPAVFLPGSPVPGWADLLVTNPAVTVGAPDEVTTGTTPEDLGTPPAEQEIGHASDYEQAKAKMLADQEAKPSEDISEDEDSEEVVTETPPVSPRPYGNATKNEWADYATNLGVVIPDGATKNEIIALVDALPATE